MPSTAGVGNIDSSSRKVQALLLFIGLPAAGKSFVSDKLVNESSKFTYIAVNFDENILFENSTDYKWKDERSGICSRIEELIDDYNKGLFFSKSHRCNVRAPKLVNEDLPVVIILDDNFYYRSMRKQYFLLSKKIRCSFLTVSLRTPLDVCVERNAKRTSSVPQTVIVRMNDRLEWPEDLTYPWERYNLDLKAIGGNFSIDVIEDFTDSVLRQPFIFIDLEKLEAEKERARMINRTNPTHIIDDILRSLVNACITSLPSDLRKNFGKEFSRVKSLTLTQLKPLANERFHISRKDFENWIQSAFVENVATMIPLNTNLI